MVKVPQHTPFFSSMPHGVFSLFVMQTVSTLSFSVLYSTLVLFMNGKLGLSMSMANSVMGVFVAFNFALHLLGGFWGGRFLSNRALFCLGMIAQTIGCWLLAFGKTELLYLALGAFLTGSGLNVTCLNCMLTQRFSMGDSRRETAFLFNYAGMNVGFFVGFSLSGYFQLSQNYVPLFLLGSLGNLIALCVCLFFWEALRDQTGNYILLGKKAQYQRIFASVLLVALLPFLLSPIIQCAEASKKMVLLIGVCMLGVLFYLGNQQPSQAEKNKMFAFAFLMIISTVFWMLYQVAPMGLNFFINYNVQRSLGGFVIPPQWFENINTLCIMIGGPLLGFILNEMRNKGFHVTVPSQFTLALLAIGMAFLLLPIGIKNASVSGLVSATWIVLCYILMSVGELFISPISYAMVGRLVPPALQGVMMGMILLNSGVGAALSSYYSNLMIKNADGHDPLLTNPGYTHIFFWLGFLAVASSVFMYFLIPKLCALLQENKPHSKLDLSAEN